MPQESNLTRTRLRLVAALGLALAVTPTPLAAQSVPAQTAPAEDGEAETRQFEDWTLRCLKKTETQDRTCRISQNVVSDKTGEPVLFFVVGRFGAERILGAIISVPIGVRLPPGLALQVDDRPPWTFPFERCNPVRCQIRGVLEKKLIHDLKAGMVGHVRFQDGSGQTANINVSLKGFTAALRALQ